MAAGIARGVDVHQDRLTFGSGLALVFGEQHRHVVADGLGEAGGGDADYLGMVLGGDVFQAQLKVGTAAVDGILFPERGGGDIDRLVEMADNIAAHIGGAALRAV